MATISLTAFAISIFANVLANPEATNQNTKNAGGSTIGPEAPGAQSNKPPFAIIGDCKDIGDPIEVRACELECSLDERCIPSRIIDGPLLPGSMILLDGGSYTLSPQPYEIYRNHMGIDIFLDSRENDAGEFELLLRQRQGGSLNDNAQIIGPGIERELGEGVLMQPLYED